MSKLSVWWLRLGIAIERIKPGNPQQNGRHERMHLTLKKETTKPPAFNFLQQQEKFDDFIEIFNKERPHQVIGMKYPGELYTPSVRIYQRVQSINYPFHDKTITVTNCERICIKKKKINLSTAFAGKKVGITETEEGIWLVSFMQFDLGYFDEDSCRMEPLDNPFKEKTLSMSSLINCHLCPQFGPIFIGVPERIRTFDPLIKSPRG